MKRSLKVIRNGKSPGMQEDPKKKDNSNQGHIN